MKRIVQLIIFLFLIFASIVFYKIYFSEENEATINNEEKNKVQSEISETKKNNLIKNLKYEITLDQNNQYIITSDLSEIGYENNLEIVKMEKVVAKIIDQTNNSLIITSNQAIYNNSNYNTNFSDNVEIQYLGNLITSNKMNINFKNNNIIISENVVYNGLQGNMSADNIKIDLITKKIKIYMNKENDKVIVESK
ncbi:LPS export ABC transporter periplasmic protein LptC [Candidatus Pelagibacter sp.]|nr:LPS export ABC transporter periplasmic protein LptC [Candidatus Pelagibacter sp.]